MKKNITLLFLTLIFIAPSMAEEDVMDTASRYSQEWDSQKVITPQEYDSVLSKLKGNVKKKKKRNEQKELMPSSILDEETIKDVSFHSEPYSATLMIPTNLFYPGGIIPIGYYKICAQKTGDKYYLTFFQGAQKIATLEAVLSQNDYNQETINYVQILPINDSFVKIIYGSIDYNLETYLQTL